MDKFVRINVIVVNYIVIIEWDVEVCVSFNSKYSYFEKNINY